MVHYYEIAELCIEIDLGQVVMPKEMEDFEIPAMDSSTVDMAISTQIVSSRKIQASRLSRCERILDTTILSIYEDSDSFWICYQDPQLVQAYQVWKTENRAVIYLIQDDLDKWDTYEIKLSKEAGRQPSGGELLLYSIRDAFFFHAQKYGRIAVHSASIIYENRVFLFAASSGTGKSTHVAQWKQAGISCEGFNGDVAMCYQKEYTPMAAGLPWCGTSGIYQNCKLPLGGIFFLQRGLEDVVRPMSYGEAAIALNARCLTPNWNRELMHQNLEVSMALVPKIQTGIVSCTPTVTAARTVKQYVDRQDAVVERRQS